MQGSFTRAAAAALVGSALLVGGCGSKQTFPAFPAAAPLSDIQAAKLAGHYLESKQALPSICTSIEPTRNGHLVNYVTIFNPAGGPPRASHLVLVKNTGGVREIAVAEGN